jgi:cold-inducible RNA-binding protein
LANVSSGSWSTPYAVGEPGGERSHSVLITAGGSVMPAKLFVGNLSFQATEEDLRELFAQAGTVESVRIVTDQFTGRPRGFGFVEMATKEEAAKAVEMLNGRLFRDRNLVVDEARPQPQRGSGGPRSGSSGPRTGGGGGGGWRR